MTGQPLNESALVHAQESENNGGVVNKVKVKGLALRKDNEKIHIHHL